MEVDSKKDIRILIVDDSDFSRTEIADMLSDYNVVGEVSTAKEAVSFLAERSIHIVITDIIMPEVSGIELAELISTKYDNVGIIMISSLNQENIVIDSIAAGANDYITKPIEKAVLISSINKLSEKILNERGSSAN